MKNHFITDNFDNVVKTLQRRERTLLGDLRDAFRDRNLDEFKKLLHQTGYKNFDSQIANFQNLSRWSILGFRKFKTTRNLLFEFDEIGESLFEEILGTQGAGVSKFINLIWTECDLWRKRDILLQTNINGKWLIDYVIKSNDDENLFEFLVFDFEQEADSVAKSSKKYFLKLKNEQYIRRTGKSLFQKFYSIIDQDTEEIILNIMNKLLQEIVEIFDIQTQTAIDEVIKMDNEIFKHKVLKLLTSYWRVYSKEYHHYKKVLSDLSPYYKLLLSLKEHNEIEFEEFFPTYINLMNRKYGDDSYELKVREDFNSLLEFALHHKQRRALSLILNCPLIDPNKVIINLRDSSFDNQHVHYVMSKLLQKGFYLGNDSNQHVPIDWISTQVFENFLNSRVKEDGINGCQIDFNFLIPPEDRLLKIGAHDEQERLLFSRSIKPLQNILNNERLKTFITHPVISTFINLKIRKYRLIFNLNFFIFIFFYMVPFFMLVTLIPFRKFYVEIFETYGELEIVNKKKVFKILGFTRPQLLLMPYYACIFATFYLTLREVLQLFVISGKLIEYFKKKSNQFEILLITMSLVILWGMKKYTITDARELLSIPSAFLIILATVELLSILPYPSMSIYMFMLKQVTNTFMKFFTIFIVVILAFTFSFCVVFKPPLYNTSPSPWRQLRRDWNNYSMTTNHSAFEQFKEPALMFTRTLENILEDNETIFRNFENPFTSFQKTLMMLSGEFTIDPYTLDSAAKQILFLLFVCTSFILFNLINGLAISDVAQLRIQAEFLNLKQQIRSAVESEKVVCDINWKTSKNCHFTPIKNIIIYIMTLLVRRYPYLHKIDNLCIDFKTKTVKYELNQKRFHILQTHGGSNQKYFLDEKSCKKLSAIVEKRHNHDRTFKEKIENLEAEVKHLKKSIHHQHEEMKQLLQQILREKREII